MRVSRSGCELPVGAAGVVIARLDGSADMRVYPEGPESVVQVECDQLG